MCLLFLHDTLLHTPHYTPHTPWSLGWSTLHLRGQTRGRWGWRGRRRRGGERGGEGGGGGEGGEENEGMKRRKGVPKEWREGGGEGRGGEGRGGKGRRGYKCVYKANPGPMAYLLLKGSCISEQFFTHVPW